MVEVVVGLVLVSSQGGSVDYWSEGEKAWARIAGDYYDSGSGQFREFWSKKGEKAGASFNWTVGVVIPVLNSLGERSKGARTTLSSYLLATEAYWNKTGPVPGYDVVPHPTGIDRYYDDNAWMARALLRSFRLTGDKKWLARAEGAVNYARSGEDDKLGGGVYWRESDKASKNTCSNSPTSVACFELYELTGKDEFRTSGLRILDWTMKHLVDPVDGLMWDNLNLRGEVETTKWSYNSALTVRALWFAEKWGRTYAISSKDMFNAAWKKWSDGKGGLSGPGKFSHLLFEAGIECGYLDRSQIRAVADGVLRSRNPEGRWGSEFDQKPKPGLHRYYLIDEASAVRVLLMAAQALGEP